MQLLHAGASMPEQAFADWELAVRLAQRLDVAVPSDLASIRAEIGVARPEYGQALLAETPELSHA